MSLRGYTAYKAGWRTIWATHEASRRRRPKLNTKKQRQDFVYTKQIKYLQIWAPKTPIKQIKYGSAPSSTNQIKYGLPYLIDLFVAECAHMTRLPKS